MPHGRFSAGAHHKVRAGRIGDCQAVSSRIATLLDTEWQRLLAPLGLGSYDELRAALTRG